MSTFFKIQTYKKPSQYSQYAEHEGESAIIGNNGNEFAECENTPLSNDPIKEKIFCLKGTRGQWISKKACIACEDMPHYCYYPYVFNPHDPQREILPYKKRSSMSKGA